MTERKERVGWGAAGTAVLALLAWSGVAVAGVEGTHHDMRLYDPTSEQSVCAYCHVPHRAKSEDNLLARGGGVEELGPIGNFCYSCHDGTVVPTALIEAADGSVGLDALLGGHGSVVARLEEITGGLETGASVVASGLVDADSGGAAPERIDCNACHDPHADQYAPFLREPFETLCQKCHSGKGGLGEGRWTAVADEAGQNWAHPVGMPYGASGFDRVRGMETELTFYGPEAVFDVALYAAEDLRNIDDHWQMGGHLFGSERRVSCGSCHSVHLPTENLLVAEVAGRPDRMVCAGCHGDGRNAENPGATPFYHPVFDSSRPPYVHDHRTHGEIPEAGIPGTGEIDLYVNMPAEWPLGADGELLCSTCHRAHRGIPGEKLLRWGPTAQLIICNECHGVMAEDAEDVEDMHHPTGQRDYNAEYNFNAETAWSWGPELPGDLRDGLQCVDCHTELAKSAHNW